MKPRKEWVSPLNQQMDRPPCCACLEFEALLQTLSLIDRQIPLVAVVPAEKRLQSPAAVAESLVAAAALRLEILAAPAVVVLQSPVAKQAAVDIHFQALASVVASAEQTKQTKPVAYVAAWTFEDSSAVVEEARRPSE